MAPQSTQPSVLSCADCSAAPRPAQASAAAARARYLEWPTASCAHDCLSPAHHACHPGAGQRCTRPANQRHVLRDLIGSWARDRRGELRGVCLAGRPHAGPRYAHVHDTQRHKGTENRASHDRPALITNRGGAETRRRHRHEGRARSDAGPAGRRPRGDAVLGASVPRCVGSPRTGSANPRRWELTLLSRSSPFAETDCSRCR
jgi:hypothetical protein